MVGGYNLMRDDTALLERHEKSPPSFSVQLYQHEWSLNDSSKKFSYSSQTSSILDDIRAFRIPTDFIDLFDEVGVPYYEGCLIVELHNYRPVKAKDPVPTQPSRERVILRPTPETVWQDICLMNAKTGSKWTDADALELEAKILLATSNPLCLDPDPNLTRVINSILRVSTPNVPSSLRRKATAMDPEEDESEKIKRTKVMQFMNPKMGPTRKPIQPSYKIIALRERERLGQLPPPQPRQVPIQAPAQAQAGAAATPPGANAVNSVTQENGTQDAAPQPPAPVQAPPPITVPAQVPVSSAISQPIPVSMPPAHIPQHLQPVADPSKRVSPVKQHSNAPTPRPPSQPVAGPSNINSQQNAAIAMQAFAHAQAQAQAQALAQQRMQAAQQHQQQQQQQQQQAAQQQQSQSQQQQASVGLGIGLSPSFSLQAPPSRRKSIASKPGGTPTSQSLPLPQGTPQTQFAQLQPQQNKSVQIPVQSSMGMQQQQQQPQQQQVPIRPQSQNQPRPQSQPQQQQQQQSPVPTQQQPVQAQQQPAQPRQQQQPTASMQQMHPGMPMSMQNMQAYMRATAAAQASGQMIPNAAMAAAAQRVLQSRAGTPANNGTGSPGPSAAAMSRSPMPPSAKISGRSGTPLVNNQALPQGPAGVTPNIQQQPMQMSMQMQGQGQVQQPAMQGASQQATALFRAQQAAYQRYLLQQMQANQMRPSTAAGQHPQMQVPMAIPQAAVNVQQKQPGQEQAGSVQQQFAAGVPQQPMFMPQNMNQQQQYMMWQQIMRQQQQRGVPQTQAQAQAQAQAQMQMQLQNGQQMPNMAAAMAYQQQMQSMGRGNGMGNRQ